MNVERIINEIGAEQGWNDATKLALCLEYISNQGDDSAFEDFLRRQAESEKQSTKEYHDDLFFDHNLEEIELDNGGVLVLDKTDQSIRRYDVDGNCEDIRNPKDQDYYELRRLFE